MAVVGDLFVQVRARTDSLTKGLRNARRSLQSFSRTGAGLIAGVAAGFSAWKIADRVLGTMMHSSAEFRDAWAGVQNTVNALLAELGAELGPILAEGLNDLNEWVKNSDYLRDIIEGLGIALREYVFPAVKDIVAAFERGSTVLAGWISDLTGVTDEWERLQKPVNTREIEAAAQARGVGAGTGFDRPSQVTAGLQVLRRHGTLDPQLAAYLDRIANNVETPR